jgi:hypothetical protein
MGAYTQPAEYIPAMINPYGVVLDDESIRWAAAEGVSEAVIAAICLLETKSVDEIVTGLTPVELEQVIKIVGRCPRCYPPGAYDALKGHRGTPLLKPQPAERISPGPDRLHGSAEQPKPAKHTDRWTLPGRFPALTRGNVRPTRAYGSVVFRAEVPQRATEHATPSCTSRTPK